MNNKTRAGIPIENVCTLQASGKINCLLFNIHGIEFNAIHPFTEKSTSTDICYVYMSPEYIDVITGYH